MKLPPIAQLVYRHQRRGALIWGSVFGMFAWVSAYGYAEAYPKVADRLSLAKSLGSNPGIRAIFGPAHHLETVTGFTAWRSSTSFILIGAIWGLLTATKVMRGDEDSGVAELLYAGAVNRLTAIGDLLLGLAVVITVVFVTVACWLVPIALYYDYFSWTAALWFSVVSIACATMFVGVGAITSQLAATRRAAAAMAGAAFGVTFLLRAIGESVDGARWVLRLSPASWVDQLRPLTGTAYGALLPIITFTVVCVGGAIWLAQHRDVGGSILPSADIAEAKTGLLGSPLGLALRLSRSTTIGWGAGVALFAAVFGVVSSAVTDGLNDNKSVNDIFQRLGADVSTRGYIGVTFIMLATVTGLVAANAVSAARAEEAEGRLEQIAAAPILTSHWLFGRVLIACGSVVVVSVLAGAGGWLGVEASGGHIPFVDMLNAGLNLIAPGVLVLGIGTLIHGIAPRYAATAAYALVVWSFLAEIVGSIVKFPSLVLDTSIIHHLAAAPAVDPRWGAAALMALVGLLAAAVGAAALQRRDLALG